MTTPQRITLLEQVQIIADANKAILAVATELGYQASRPILDISTKLNEVNALILAVSSNPSVDIQTQPPCLS